MVPRCASVRRWGLRVLPAWRSARPLGPAGVGGQTGPNGHCDVAPVRPAAAAAAAHTGHGQGRPAGPGPSAPAGPRAHRQPADSCTAAVQRSTEQRPRGGHSSLQQRHVQNMELSM